MKILIVSSNKNDSNKLVEEIGKKFKLKKFYLNGNDLKEINKTIVENKEWLIIINNDIGFDVIATQSNKIIYLNYNKDILNIHQITKYSRKMFILKNKKEEKIIIKSFDKGHEFYY